MTPEQEQQLGQLMIEEKRLLRETQELESTLQKVGGQYEELGRRMRETPESVVFANIPPGLSAYDLSQASRPDVFDWRQMHSLEPIAQKLMDLTLKTRRLQEVRRQMASLPRP